VARTLNPQECALATVETSLGTTEGASAVLPKRISTADTDRLFSRDGVVSYGRRSVALFLAAIWFSWPRLLPSMPDIPTADRSAQFYQRYRKTIYLLTQIRCRATKVTLTGSYIVKRYAGLCNTPRTGSGL
jgi:hypothetical protein